MPKQKSNATVSPIDPVVDVAAKLHQVAKILALSVVRTEKREDQVTFLHSCGFTPVEIGALLLIPPNAVSVVLYQQKKRQRKRRKSKT